MGCIKEPELFLSKRRKKMKKLLFFLLLLLLFISSQSFAQIQRPEKVPVGTIIASMLSPKQMAEITAPGIWVVADGRPVDRRSQYFRLTNNERTPDLRSMFLRGLPNFDSRTEPRSDGFAISDHRTRPGTTQKNAFKNHQHELGKGSSDAPEKCRGATERYASFVGDELNFSTTILKTHGIGHEEETRPNNVAVYYYLKVN